MNAAVQTAHVQAVQHNKSTYSRHVSAKAQQSTLIQAH